MIQRLCYTFYFLIAALSCHGVELTNEQYQQVKQDVKQFYRDDKASLSYLTAFAEQGQWKLTPADPRQGELWIKLPLAKDAVRILQVPHGFFDLHTREIGEAWFSQSEGNANFDVLMVNTEHRYETEQSDLSRLDRSLFTAFVDALIEMEYRALVVQIHGYNRNGRETLSATDADFILSDGTPFADAHFLKKQSCLRDNAGLLARVFGSDVYELGATINPVGRLIREKKPNMLAFLHIEMPLHIRRAMIENALPEEVIGCLLSQ